MPIKTTKAIVESRWTDRIIGLVFFAALIWVILSLSNLRDETIRRNHESICDVQQILLDKAQKDLKGAQAVLRRNPNGIPGFPRTAILQAIGNDKAVVIATTDPTCPERGSG